MKEKIKTVAVGLLVYAGFIGMFIFAYWWGYIKN